MKKYYVLEEEYERGPIKGDVFVWEGDYWNNTANSTKPELLVRYLYDFDGFFFIVPRSDLVEFVSERELEDPDKYHDHPADGRKIWNVFIERM